MKIRPASPADVGQITACICEAFLPYIERMGKQPAPMLADYAAQLETRAIFVAARGDAVWGVVVFDVQAAEFWIEAVAVRSAHRGTGVGRQLLQFAEAHAARLGHATVDLVTHQLMTENRALYERIGYVSQGARTEAGYARVHYRKTLGADAPGAART
ncbi:MAG: GNAT family N-acetyltransferase [Pseudomonadota bacterium]